MQTRVYDFNTCFKSFLSDTAVKARNDSRPQSIDDLVNFGVRPLFAPTPAYHRMLYCDNGLEGMTQGHALLVEFLAYLCESRVKLKFSDMHTLALLCCLCVETATARKH